MLKDVKAFHIPQVILTAGGIPLNGFTYFGGYTVVTALRKDGRYNVTIVQCSPKNSYDKELGCKIGLSRMKEGKYFVNTMDELVATLATLADKMDNPSPEMENISG